MKKMMVIFFLSATFPIWGQSPLSLDLSAELGFLGIIKHEIQAGSASDKGDLFDYREQGNQDILFPYTRFQADFEIFQRHHAVLLYQPLTLETQAPITKTFRYNGDTYDPSDGFLNLVYSFDFWRLSYLYDIIEGPGYFLSAGLSLQIRNASIEFRSEVNGKGSVEDNIGPVPIIKVRMGYQWDNGFSVLFDGDGFYASNAFINGAEYEFMGYIYDLSLKGLYQFHSNSSVYLNIRFLGGGADGTNDDDQFTYNDLHTFALSLGVVLHL